MREKGGRDHRRAESPERLLRLRESTINSNCEVLLNADEIWGFNGGSGVVPV
jgi:hypothetical protein